MTQPHVPSRCGLAIIPDPAREATTRYLMSQVGYFVDGAPALERAERSTLRALLDPHNPFSGLVDFSRQLRSHLSDLSRRSAAFDSKPFWNVIDGIGFLEDSVPGRWKYLTTEQLKERLAWARDHIDLAVRAI